MNQVAVYDASQKRCAGQRFCEASLNGGGTATMRMRRLQTRFVLTGGLLVGITVACGI